MIRGGLPGRSTATVQPAQEKDNRGTPIGAVPEPYEVEGCWLAPNESTVNHDRASTVVTTRTLYAPADGAFPTGAKVTVAGYVGLVVGDPEPWAPAGQSVHLQRVAG